MGFFLCFTNVFLYMTNDLIWVAFCLISERLLFFPVIFDSIVDSLGNILIIYHLMFRLLVYEINQILCSVNSLFCYRLTYGIRVCTLSNVLHYYSKMLKKESHA